MIDTAAGGADDDVGEVEFLARFTSAGRAGSMHERSRFQRRAGRWFYVDDVSVKRLIISVFRGEIGQIVPLRCRLGGKICSRVVRLNPCRHAYNRNEAPPMTADLPDSALELRSLVTSQGTLELSLHDVPVPTPAANEVLVRVEASPINPSDLGLLIAGADMTTATVAGTPERPIVTASLGAGAAGRTFGASRQIASGR